MGSNIFNTALGKPVWMIGNGVSGQVKTLTKQMGKSPLSFDRVRPFKHKSGTSGDIVVDRSLELPKKHFANVIGELSLG